MKKLEWTGERLQTELLGQIALEHLHRYAIVKSFIVNKKVVDIACGEGYGSYLISHFASNVVGIDISDIAIAHANQKYNHSNLQFIEGSASDIPIEQNTIDVVVSFETIEHHDKHDEMMKEIVRILKPDGVLIISSPDKYYYSDVPNFKNLFHVKELYYPEFKLLIKNHFKFADFYFQRCVNQSSYIGKPDLFEKTSVFDGNYEQIISKDLPPLYNIAICSNFTFPPQLNQSFFEGTFMLNRRFEEQINTIKKTFSYRLGNFVIKPMGKIVRFLRNYTKKV